MTKNLRKWVPYVIHSKLCPKQIGTNAIKIDGVFYPVKVFESIEKAAMRRDKKWRMQ